MASEPEAPSFVSMLQTIIDEAGGVEKLAAEAKVAPATISKWRRGQHPRVRIGQEVQAVHSWATKNVENYPPDDGPAHGLLGFIRAVPRGRGQESAAETPDKLSNPGENPAVEARWSRRAILWVVFFALAAGGVGVAYAATRPEPQRTIFVLNKVAIGETLYREDQNPAYLSSQTVARCAVKGCQVSADYRTGQALTATCFALGEAMTNADLSTAGIERNPERADSSLWYYAEDDTGAAGYLSEVYLAPTFRGGLGLPQC